MKLKTFVLVVVLISTFVLFIDAKSLWVDSAELFLDRKPMKEGDPITILFNNNTIVKYKAQSEGSGNSSLTPPKSTSPAMSFLPDIDFSSEHSYTKNVDTSSDGTIEGSITAQVLSVTNNNLLIGGQHTIIVNGESENISITALASPKRIKKGSLIYSTDLINPVIVYRGLTVSRGTNYTEENVTIGTNETGAATLEFTEEEKNKIIMDYLNKSLESLFSY